MDFNHWDIILSIPLFYAAWKGFRKGLIVELASIAALIAGIYIAANFSEYAAGLISEYAEVEGTWLSYLSFILTFAAVVFGVYALAKIVEKAVNLVALKLVNKLSGLLFGVLKMALILSVVLNLLTWLDQHIPILEKSSPERSMFFEPVQALAPAVLPILTDSDWLMKAESMVSPLIDDEADAYSPEI